MANDQESTGETAKSNFLEPITETIKERVISPFWGTLIIYWILFNTRPIMAFLFSNSERVFQQENQLKHIYIYQEYLKWDDPWTFVNTFLLPLIATAVTIWVISPRVSIWAFKQKEEDVTTKKKYRAQKKQEIQDEEKKIIEERKKIAEEKKEAVQEESAVEAQEVEAQQKNQESQEQQWEQEFKAFQGMHDLYNSFNSIIESVYNYQGEIEVTSWDAVTEQDITDFFIPNSILVYAHTNGIVEYQANGRISLTEKGKYFVRRYTEEQNRKKSGKE